MRTIFPIACCLLLMVPSALTSTAEVRVESQPYVARVTSGCDDSSGGFVAHRVEAPLERVISSLLGDGPLPPRPPVPDDARGPTDATAEEERGVCFQLQPGDSTVTLSVADDHFSEVSYWIGIGGTTGGWITSQTRCSLDDGAIVLPEGATHLSVNVHPVGVACVNEGPTVQRIVDGLAFGSTGIVTASFA